MNTIVIYILRVLYAYKKINAQNIITGNTTFLFIFLWMKWTWLIDTRKGAFSCGIYVGYNTTRQQ